MNMRSKSVDLQTYNFKIGAFECIAIDDGPNEEYIEALFDGIPTNQLVVARRARGLEEDKALPCNNLLVKTGEHTVLIDSGQNEGKLLRNLQEEGISPADIDTLIITHIDSDHVGGLTDKEGNLIFANAHYVMGKDGYDLWSSDGILDELVDSRADFIRDVLPHLRKRLKTVKDGEEFLPGFQAISAPSHREDHIVLRIASEGDILLHVADAMQHLLYMAYPMWLTAWDSYPEDALPIRRKLLKQAVAEKALIFGPHLGFPGLGRVSKEGEGWRWQPVEDYAG
jgi:glyoxylase-like metal-dependent hydrolase (beta-lactamase superfamily II)